MSTESLMTRNVIVVPPEMNLAAAQELMDRWRIRHLPVVRDGRLVGILSDRDVLRYQGFLGEGLDASAGAVATPAPVTCAGTTPVSRVAQIMLVDSVPVVNAMGGLVGLVTSSDLLQLLVEHPGIEALPFHYALRMSDEDGLAADVG